MTTIDEVVQYAEGEIAALYALHSRLPSALHTSSIVLIESLT